MSALRKVHEQQVAGAQMFIKLLRGLGWGMAGLGGLLCLTLIGIPVGILMMMFGAMCIFSAKLLVPRIQALSDATAEVAELHEQRLREVRGAESPRSSPSGS